MNKQKESPFIHVDLTDYPALIKELEKRWTPEQWENFIRNTEHLRGRMFHTTTNLKGTGWQYQAGCDSDSAKS